MQDKKRKVGLYFGSFNPIHNGHLAIANFCAEHYELDEVWLVIAKQNPFKDPSTYAPIEIRKSMITASIESNSKLKLCDIEETLPSPSYTYKTIRELKKEYPNDDYYVIMGSDSFETILTWSHGEEILDNHLIVFPRNGYSDIKAKISEYEKSLNHNIDVIEGISDVVNNMSSSFIRHCISANQKVVGYVPIEAIKIIEDSKIYK